MDWLQLGTLAVLAAAALFAGWQVWEARNDRRQRHRPFVVVDFEEAATIFVELQVHNIGATPAKDVVLTFDQEPETSMDKGRWPALNAAIFGEGVPLMPPDRRIRMLFDRVPDRIKDDLPMRHLATVRYRDDRGKRYEESYPLDLDSRRGYRSISFKGVHDGVKELEGIRKALEQ